MPDKKVNISMSKSVAEQFLKRVSTTSAGAHLNVGMSAVIEVLDADPTMWMARRAGSLTITPTIDGCKISAASPEILNAARSFFRTDN